MLYTPLPESGNQASTASVSKVEGEVPGAVLQDVEFTAEFSQLGDWISDVKKVFKEELFESGKAK
jgi:hypothetical protein